MILPDIFASGDKNCLPLSLAGCRSSGSSRRRWLCRDRPGWFPSPDVWKLPLKLHRVR